MNFYKLKLYNNLTLSEVLFILIPLFLVGSGPFFSNLAVSIISLLFIYKTLLKKTYIQLDKYFYFTLICFIILIISSIASKYFLPSFLKSLAYLRFLIFPIAICYLLNKNKNLFLYFYKVLFLCIFFVTIDGIIQYILGENSIGLIMHYFFDIEKHPFRLMMGYKVQGFFADEGILGSYLSRLFPILIGLSIYLKKIHNKSFYFIYLLVSLNILLSGERVALVLFILTNFCLILFIDEIRIKLIKIFFCIFVIYFSVIFLNTKIYDRMIKSTINSVIIVNESKEIDFFLLSKEHEPLVISATKIFKNNFIFGAGPTNFRRACNERINFILDENSNTFEKACSTHPHNYFFQILAEIGIVGIFFYFSCIFYFLSRIILTKNKIPNSIRCMIIATFLTVFPFITTGNFFNSWLSCIHFLPIPFILNYFQKVK